MLSQEMFKELREIVRKDFGENLDERELFEFGENLLTFFELLTKIYSREKSKSEKENFVKCPKI